MSHSFEIVRPAPHDDEGFLRPKAWQEAKEAFGLGGDIAEMLTHLEKCRTASPRLLLAAAIHAFLQMNDSQQTQVVQEYLASSVPPRRSGMPPGVSPAARSDRRQIRQ
ncbi:hypothetical protein [Humisphaera borealis]|uniref:Uncharacterized protein n=1 Tax=Humisphaera borealis TaxID=2807512 RepID=A0A7M2X0C4_9BACT|nr:hypothetical protein [Humisphaera borealis]QOV91145.1 hypothetical protein IPV69_07245 [Humisphaera borealis]